jgi:oligopeptide transport system ATP-binding protein
MSERETLVSVEDLQVHFPVRRGLLVQRQVAAVRAVDGVSFAIARGETLGLVGESGCGKSTTGRAILNLTRPTAGRVLFAGEQVSALSGETLRRLRRRMQMIFQDPYSSLNPRMTVGDTVAEPMLVHGLHRGAELARRAAELLELVGLDPEFRRRYPHEFSGGQRQRIGIARALAAEPDFIVCDEAIAALDVSVQAQIINLLQDLQQRLALTYLFISHDLSVVRHISDRIAVMYLGRIVELSHSEDIYSHPRHPYTLALLSAVPLPDPVSERSRQQIILRGELSTTGEEGAGCRFAPRCPRAEDLCRRVEPQLEDAGRHHWVACHYA